MTDENTLASTPSASESHPRPFPSRRALRAAGAARSSNSLSGTGSTGADGVVNAPSVTGAGAADARPQPVWQATREFPAAEQEKMTAVKVVAPETKLAPVVNRRRDQRSRVRKRHAMRRRTLLIVPLLVGVLAVGLVLAGLYIKRTLDARGEDYQGIGTVAVNITVPEGATGSTIGDILAKADVVASSQAFYNACLAQEVACKSIQPGTYQMAQQMAAANALSILIDEANRVDEQITVGPGLTKWQVKEQLVTVGGFSPEEIEAAFVAAPGLPAEAGGNVEGWLAPGSYLASPGKTAADVVGQMIAKSLERLQDTGLDKKQWQPFLTKASIVQREGSDLQKQDYAKIARVIENRADTSKETVGFLNMDSTVIYGLGESATSRRIPTAAEVRDSGNPYNTYVNKGLPPSPIGAIGEDAFRGMLNPEPGDWLYFTTVDLTTGETRFSATQEEQDANVQRLRDFCENNPDVCQN